MQQHVDGVDGGNDINQRQENNMSRKRPRGSDQIVVKLENENAKVKVKDDDILVKSERFSISDDDETNDNLDDDYISPVIN